MKHLIIALSFLSLAYTCKANGYLGGGLSYSSNGKGKVTFVFSFLKDCNYCDSGKCDISKLTLKGANYEQSFDWNLDSSNRVSRPTHCVDCDRCTDPNCEFEYGLSLLFYSCQVDISSAIAAGGCQFTASLSTSAISDRITTGPAGFEPFHELNFEACIESESPKIASFGSLIPLGDNRVDRIFKAQNDSSLSFFKSIVNKNGSTVKYNSPYTASKAWSYLGFPKDYDIERLPFGVHLDSFNSILSFRPMKLEHSITRISHHQFRNGKIIGTSHIDYYVGVGKELDEVPAYLIMTRNNTELKLNNTVGICEGDTLRLRFSSLDRDSTDSTKLSWDKSLPNATFKILDPEVKDQQADLIWTPPAGSVNREYHFVVTGNNIRCPISTTSSVVVNLKVLPKPNAEVKVELADSFGTALFMANQKGLVQVQQYLWNIDGSLFVRNGTKPDSLMHRFKYDSTYPYQLMIIAKNGCVNTLDWDSLDVKSIRYSVDLAAFGIEIYPNPASDYLLIENNSGQEIQARLHRIDGRFLLEQSISEGSSRIDISSFASGVYLLSLEIKHEKIQSKLIIE